MADDLNTESLLHEITSAVPGVVYQFSARPDGSYEINYVSRQSEAILGIKSNSNTFFEDFTRCIPKEDQFEFLDSIQKAVEKVEEWRYEGRFIKPSGETIWISAHSVPVKKENRVVFNGVLVDVTDRKRAEQALKNSERRLKDIIEFLPDATFAIDKEGKVIAWNRAIEEMTGVSAADMLGKGNYEYAIPFYGKRRPMLIDLALHYDPGLEKDYLYVKRSGDTLIAEANKTLVCGKQLPLFGKASPLYDANGEIVGAIESIRDMSERNKAIDALWKSEFRFSTLVGNVQAVIFMLDKDGVFQLSEGLPLEKLGLKPGQLVGESIFEKYKDYPEVINCVKEAIQGHEARAISEIQGVVFDVIYSPFYTEEGEVDGVIGVATDITEHITAEQEILASQQRLSLLIENSPLGVIEWDANFRVSRWNPAAEKIFGFSSEEAIGKYAFDLLVPEHEREFVKNVWEKLRASKSQHRGINENLTKDGRLITCEWSTSSLVDNDGKFLGVVSIVDDITERRRAEEQILASQQRLSLLIERSPLGVIEWDLDFRVSRWNKAAEEIFGYTEEEAIGKHGYDLIVPKSVQEYVDPIWVELISGRGGHRGTNENITKDGRTIICDWYNTTLIDNNGQVVGVMSLVEDVTEERRAAELERELEKKVEEHRRKFYRDAILSITEGKMDICNEEDVVPFIQNSNLSVEITGAESVSDTRRYIRECCIAFGLDEDSTESFILGVGEAITNAVKHGQSGKIYIGNKKDMIWVVVSDKGPGISSLVLPQAVLKRGFSTKTSMGLGYSIMLDVADRILLFTESVGTTVVLIKHKVPVVSKLTLDDLPDTW